MSIYSKAQYNSDLEAKHIKDEKETNKLQCKTHPKLENISTKELEKREQCELEQQRILSIRCDRPNYWGPNAFASYYQKIGMIEKTREKNNKNQ